MLELGSVEKRMDVDVKGAGRYSEDKKSEQKI